jgi:hypothetical protein
MFKIGDIVSSNGEIIVTDDKANRTLRSFVNCPVTWMNLHQTEVDVTIDNVVYATFGGEDLIITESADDIKQETIDNIKKTYLICSDVKTLHEYIKILTEFVEDGRLKIEHFPQ